MSRRSTAIVVTDTDDCTRDEVEEMGEVAQSPIDLDEQEKGLSVPLHHNGNSSSSQSATNAFGHHHTTSSSGSKARSRGSAVKRYVHAHGHLSDHRDELHLLETKEETTAHPLALRHLFKKPIVRQWYEGGKLKRSAEGRESFRFELYLDLIYVGVLHQIADAATNDLGRNGGEKVGDFLLVYYPSYLIWSDIRVFLTFSGTDDIIQRFYLLATMFILIGYTGNVTAINEYVNNLGIDQARTPFIGAIGFLLTGTAIRVSRQLIYAITLWPKFTAFYLAAIVPSLCISFVFLPLCFVDQLEPYYILPPVGCLIGTIFDVTFLVTASRLVHSRLNDRHCIPALNYEHFIDRTYDFVVLVLGETVLSSTYSGLDGGQAGLGSQFGRAALSISISFCIAWIYFAQASARRYIHAVRRHWASQLAWTLLHFSVTAGLVLAGACAGHLVVDPFDLSNEDDLSTLTALRWTLGGSLAVILTFLANMGHCHRSLDVSGASLIPRRARIGARYVAALINGLVPLAPGLQEPTKTLAVHACILFALLAVEVFGKIGAWAPDEFEDEHVHKAPKEAHHILGPSVGAL